MGAKTMSNPERDFKAEPVNGKEVKITEYLGDKWEVVIPSHIQGLPVTCIERGAFRGKFLIGVTIPGSVTEIGDRAFEGEQLTSVTIGKGVTKIGHSAFEGNQLTSVTIPGSVTEIGYSAFEGNQLTSVAIPGSVTVVEGRAFSNNKLTSIIFGNGVIEIGYRTFTGNQLTSVTIGDRITTQKLSNGFRKEYRSMSESFGTDFNYYNAGMYTRADTDSKTWTKV
jgi:hypothetical protein